MGAWVGHEESLLASAPDNPRGFWERQDTLELNDALLHSAGGDWASVVDLKLEHISQQEKIAFLDKARAIITDLDRQSTWVAKDPRICISLALWRKVLKDAVFIIVSRNPVEIAPSLKRRNHLSMARGISLWEYYMLEALRETQHDPRVAVSYNNLVSAPEKTVVRLFNALSDLSIAGLVIPQKELVLETIDKNLYRERLNPSCALSYLNREQQELFESLENNTCLSWQNVPTLSLGALDYLQQHRIARQVLAEEKHPIKVLGQLEETSNRLFESLQYRFGCSVIAFFRRLFGKPQILSSPNRLMKLIFQAYKKIQTRLL